MQCCSLCFPCFPPQGGPVKSFWSRYWNEGEIRSCMDQKVHTFPSWMIYWCTAWGMPINKLECFFEAVIKYRLKISSKKYQLFMKNLVYLDLQIECQRMWNKKVEVIPVVIGAAGNSWQEHSKLHKEDPRQT